MDVELLDAVVGLVVVVVLGVVVNVVKSPVVDTVVKVETRSEVVSEPVGVTLAVGRVDTEVVVLPPVMKNGSDHWKRLELDSSVILMP